MEKDSAVLSNEKALKGALWLDIFLVVLFAGGFCLYIVLIRFSFKKTGQTGCGLSAPHKSGRLQTFYGR